MINTSPGFIGGPKKSMVDSTRQQRYRKIKLHREAVRNLGLEGKLALVAQRRPH